MRWMMLLTLVACGTAGTDDTDGDSDTLGVAGLGLTQGGATITIDEQWRTCDDASDCVLVDISCDGCCGQDAIAESRQDEWPDAFADMCADYEGAECDCEFQQLDVACTAGVCEAVVAE